MTGEFILGQFMSG